VTWVVIALAALVVALAAVIGRLWFTIRALERELSDDQLERDKLAEMVFESRWVRPGRK
jgi:hypothetical protein